MATLKEHCSLNGELNNVNKNVIIMINVSGKDLVHSIPYIANTDILHTDSSSLMHTNHIQYHENLCFDSEQMSAERE